MTFEQYTHLIADLSAVLYDLLKPSIDFKVGDFLAQYHSPGSRTHGEKVRDILRTRLKEDEFIHFDEVLCNLLSIKGPVFLDARPISHFEAEKLFQALAISLKRSIEG